MRETARWVRIGSERWGWKVGPVFWHYNLTAGAEFAWRYVNKRLRFYGVRVGPWAIGVIREQPRPATPHDSAVPTTREDE